MAEQPGYWMFETSGVLRPVIEPDRYRLGEPTRTDLQDLCEAMFGADQAKIIRAAVATFIKVELKENRNCALDKVGNPS